ncbi:MAG: type II toxin-antitoxin system RelE/ParE family toxin [Pseudomonadota bacterium]
MAEVADYLYQQQGDARFVVGFLNRIEEWLDTILAQFPESGTPVPELSDNARRVVYKRYSFIYRYDGESVEILTVYRENLP